MKLNSQAKECTSDRNAIYMSNAVMSSKSTQSKHLEGFSTAPGSRYDYKSKKTSACDVVPSQFMDDHGIQTLKEDNERLLATLIGGSCSSSTTADS